jgi:hypothetical protein
MSFMQFVDAAEDVYADFNPAVGNVIKDFAGRGGPEESGPAEQGIDTAERAHDVNDLLNATPDEMEEEPDPVGVAISSAKATNDVSRDLDLYHDDQGNTQGVYDHAIDDGVRESNALHSGSEVVDDVAGGVTTVSEMVTAPEHVMVDGAIKGASELWSWMAD